MEFKGTKGEWEFIEYHSGELIGVRVISDSENEKIFDTGLRGYIDDETEANAKLISCAPELLQLLEETLRLQKDHVKSGCNTRFLNINKIEELIKKATT